MTELKAGYGLDANGYIVSDVGIEKIHPTYMPCIQGSITSLQQLFPDQLHSVYLYGSVARGDAVIRKSDVDLIAMFKEDLSSEQLIALKQLAEKLSETYQTLVRDVGIAVANYKYTMDPVNYYESAFLKELCVCMYGKDVGEKLGPYKLTSEIAISFNGDIQEVHNRTLGRLETATDKEFNLICQNFCRKLIRTVYSMVMVRSQIWTTRLSEQADVVSLYFPEKESIVSTLLKWIDNPPMNRDVVLKLFKREGDWASENFVKEARKSS